MNDKPRTVEEFAALPVGDLFGVETYTFTDADKTRGYAEINGVRVEVTGGVKSVEWPVARDDVVAYFDDGGVNGYRDSEGVNWKLGRYADGRWFKRRV